MAIDFPMRRTDNRTGPVVQRGLEALQAQDDIEQRQEDDIIQGAVLRMTEPTLVQGMGPSPIPASGAPQRLRPYASALPQIDHENQRRLLRDTTEGTSGPQLRRSRAGVLGALSLLGAGVAGLSGYDSALEGIAAGASRGLSDVGYEGIREDRQQRAAFIDELRREQARLERRDEMGLQRQQALQDRYDARQQQLSDLAEARRYTEGQAALQRGFARRQQRQNQEWQERQNALQHQQRMEELEFQRGTRLGEIQKRSDVGGYPSRTATDERQAAGRIRSGYESYQKARDKANLTNDRADQIQAQVALRGYVRELQDQYGTFEGPADVHAMIQQGHLTYDEAKVIMDLFNLHPVQGQAR